VSSYHWLFPIVLHELPTGYWDANSTLFNVACRDLKRQVVFLLSLMKWLVASIEWHKKAVCMILFIIMHFQICKIMPRCTFFNFSFKKLAYKDFQEFTYCYESHSVSIDLSWWCRKVLGSIQSLYKVGSILVAADCCPIRLSFYEAVCCYCHAVINSQTSQQWYVSMNASVLGWIKL
jgi:hypothetical protein